jgi:putative membrane protein
MRRGCLALAFAVLACAWVGPLPALARQSFAAHMTIHMAVVAVAAPLMALAVAGTTLDPVRITPRFLAPIPASMLELVTVWAWHAPALHHAARHHTWALILEQTTFLGAGLFLWMSAIGGDHDQRRLRAGAGTIALLITSMHMTLLGALFALANRPLFQHAALSDQHLGGAIMLVVGGASYLAGGLWLTATILRSQSTATLKRQQSPSP